MRSRKIIKKELISVETSNVCDDTDMVLVMQNRIIIELLLDIRDNTKNTSD